MPKPTYFDSQAQAAAALNVEIEVLRQAKRDGCTAFRSGRVYRQEIAAWLAERQPRAASQDDDGPEPPNHTFVHWDDRRSMLLELVSEFLTMNFKRGKFTPAQYAKMGLASIDPVLQLGRIWKAGIDEKSFRAIWTAEFARAKKSRANG